MLASSKRRSSETIALAILRFRFILCYSGNYAGQFMVGSLSGIPQPGEFVRVRSRRWLVEDGPLISGLNAVRLACIDDDAQGEAVSVLWDAELDAEVLVDEGWANVSKLGTDDPSVFSAYLRTLRWNTATAADRNLFQAPFRAGIHQDAYQLLPLQKALRLPRVNLLIADDVGAGKTVEAALILRELLLRRRIDFVLVAAPAGMVRQWQDELEAKFGLTFTIIDREYLAVLRRERGYGANPWAAGSRFLISHSLMSDETYVGGLRDLLGDFRPRALLILDEAHHAAPASGSRYAVDSQFTRAIRGLAERFEHRLFLSATPHNGHSNSFSALLEILDPQRFTSGVPVKPRELEPVMVRRLKSDLRYFGEKFPERKVEAFVIKDLPSDAPELLLSRKLLNYGEALRAKTANIGAREAGLVRLSFVGLQQRLLSSIAAFAKTLGGTSQGPRPGECRRGSGDGGGVRPGRRRARGRDRRSNRRGERSSRPRRRRRPRRPARWRRAPRTSRSSTRCWRSPGATPRTPTRASGCSRRGSAVT